VAMSQEFGMQVRGAIADVVELIPNRIRLVLYILAVCLAVAALAAQRVVAIWVPEYQEQVDATVAEILPWALFVIGVLGTAYTPNQPNYGLLPPAEPGPYEVAQAQATQAQTVATLMANGWTKEEASVAVTQQTLLPAGESPGFVSSPPSSSTTQ
jgi:hypothetical protein